MEIRNGWIATSSWLMIYFFDELFFSAAFPTFPVFGMVFSVLLVIFLGFPRFFVVFVIGFVESLLLGFVAGLWGI